MVGKSQPFKAKDKNRFDAFRAIGCLACRYDRNYRDAEVHHVVEAGRRIEDESGNHHQMTVPLCDWHHRGLLPDRVGGNAEEFMRERFGPSLARQAKAFRDYYGTERDLIRVTNVLVGMVNDARLRGEYLPHGVIEDEVRRLFHEWGLRDG